MLRAAGILWAVINAAKLGWLLPSIAAFTAVDLDGQELFEVPPHHPAIVVTNVQQMRAVETNWASGLYEARLNGTIVFVNPPLRRLYLLVEDDGVQVNLTGEVTSYRLGQRVQVAGNIVEGEPTLRLRNSSVTVVGDGPMPEAKPVTSEQLMAGRDGYRYGRLRGMVRDIYAQPAGLHLILSEGSQPIEVTINAPEMALPEEWMDAELEVTGIPFPLHRPTIPRVRAIWFHCYSTNDVRVVRPGHARRFDHRPLLTIAEAVGQAVGSKDRIRIAGTVTGSKPGVGYFVDDGTGVMYVDSTLVYLNPPAAAQKPKRELQTPLQPGERVEVIGVLDHSFSLSPSLVESEYRRIGQGKPVKPIPVTLNELKEGRHAGRLVTLPGHLVDQRAWQSSDLISHQAFVFRVDDEVFQAQWDSEARMHWDLKEGRYYSIVGVNEAEGGSAQNQSVFRLRIRTPEDIQPAIEPPLWRRRETGRVLLTAAGVAALAGVWILSYRFKVRQLERNIGARTLELRESERKFRTLYESAGNAVVVHDLERILDCNPATIRMLGYASRAELIGRPPEILAAPSQPDGEDSSVAARRHLEAARQKGSHQFEWLCRRADGAPLHAEAFLTRVELDGRTAFQAVLHDVTEQKRAEAERERSLADQKQLSELKSRFVATVSHEFRTPLGIIMSSAEILESYLDRLPEAERLANLQDITKSARHMSELMEEVLLLGRVESGKMSCRPEALDLTAFCQKIVDDVTTATGGHCRMTLQLAAGLPDATGDQGLLRHILNNLLNNAVKYSPAGGIVELTVEAHGELARFTVRDHGIGIPEADQGQIFQAFHRGRNVGQISGTGLGMVIAKHCTQLHGGRISFQSREDHGAIFTVELPLFSAETARG